jgi:RHS repeat-associated protein
VKGCEAAVAKTYATTYIYNGKGQLTQVDGPRTDATPDDITMHSYFPNTDVQQYGFLATVTNPLSQGTSYSGYDSMGQPGTVTDANLVQTTLTYDEMERIASSTIVGGIPSENISTSYSYDDHVGHLASVTNARNFVTNYGEDAAHRLTDVTDPLGNVRHTDYDLMSRSVREELRDSGSTVHQFTNFANDAFGRVTHVCFTGSVVDCPSAAVHTNVFYDGDGNLMREEDPLGHATDYGRDQLNRLSTVTQTTGASTLVTTYQYDAQDSLITVTDPKGLQNIYTNSDTGWRLTASTPDAGSMTYTYDAAGNVLTSTDTVPVAIGRTYDSMNRLLTVVYPNSSLNVTYSYDAVDSPPGTYFNVGHRTLMADSSGAAAYHYDRRGLLRSEEKTVGARRYVTAYEYDKTGNLTQVRFPTESPILRQGQADFTYDAADRVSGVIANVNGASTPVADTFAYKPFGPRTSLRFGNTLVDSRTFGTRYQVGTWTSGSLLSYTYAFNDDLNLTGVTDNLNATNNRTFGYDGVHRLTLGAAIGLWGPGTSCSGATYTYDSNGFRTCKGEDGTSTSYSPVAGKNRLNSETTGGTTTAYAYDTHGNTTGVTVTPPGTTRTFQYDQSDRLSAVLDPGPTTVASYVYDGDARRVSATSGTTTTIFLYDQGGRLLTEIVPGNTTIGKDYVYLAASPLARVDWTITETDLSGSPGPLLVNKSSPNVHLDWANAAGSGSHVVRRKQVVNPADKTFNGSTVVAGVTDPTRMYDDPVLNDTNRYDYKVLRKTSNDTLYFYHSDHLGTPIAMTDTLGATKWRAEYRPFGGVQSLTSTIVNSLRLPGQYEAPETGLYYNVNRWFENRSGRYSQTDPVYLAGFSPYSYALNDPIGISDPLGLLPAGFSAEDTCLICTVYGEARGQSTPCQEAVASVILNRVANCRALRRQTSVCSVVSSRGQFRAYNNNNYRSCASCTQPGTVPELPPILTTLTNPFAVGPAADFFANNEPKAIRDIKKGVPQPLDPVSFPNCSTFAFFRVRRAPSGRPQQPGYCK